MIHGIGIDSVVIERCALWQHYNLQRLERIFSPNEITYCFSHRPSTTQRFAALFAVKEASYKAFCSAYPNAQLPFLTWCKLVELKHQSNGAPTIGIAWEHVKAHIPTVQPLRSHASITHTHTCATAMVIFEF